MLKNCQVCDKGANSFCTGCFAIAYCGRDHQKEDWKGHKKNCVKAYKIKDDPVAGRVMQANRDLNEGDIILKERAVLVGPNIDSSSKPVCIICFKSTQNSFKNCVKCMFPLCSLHCAANPLHKQECKILSQNTEALFYNYKNGSVSKRKKVPINVNYQAILVLRGLLLEDKQLESVMSLQSHLEERQQMGKLKIVEDTILPIIQQFKIKGASAEKVHTLCGIFDTNCFELFPSGAADTISGVFPSAAMMMHSCYKNTRLMFSDDHMLTLIARCEVKKGENLYHNYARTFNPTNIRRIGLFSGKHFSCECKRCKDPTELKTYTSAFLCPCSGQVLPEDPLDLTAGAVWKCKKCSKSTPTLEMAAKERNLLMEIEAINRLDVEKYEAFIENNKSILYGNHAFILKAKKELSVAYGGYPGYDIQAINNQRLSLKEEYCGEIIELCNILEPGLSTQKGLSLYELWKAKSEINKRKLSNKLISKDEFLRNLKKNVETLEDSYRIMSYEAENSLHGAIAKDIKKLIKDEKSN